MDEQEVSKSFCEVPPTFGQPPSEQNCVNKLTAKINGQSCSLPNNLAGSDDSQPSVECQSGYCIDISGFASGGGMCGNVPLLSGKSAFPECNKIPFDLGAFLSKELFKIGTFGITTWMLIAVGIFLLLLAGGTKKK